MHLCCWAPTPAWDEYQRVWLCCAQCAAFVGVFATEATASACQDVGNGKTTCSNPHCCPCCAGWLANFALRSKGHFGAAQQALAHKPCQLLMGTRDQFTSAHTVRKWVQSFNRTLTGSAEDTGCAMQLSVVETASHFWETRQARQELSEAIDLFITSLCSHPGRTMTPAR